MPRPAAHQPGPRREAVGQPGAVEAAQRGGDVGQQRAGDEVAAGHADGAAGERDERELGEERGGEAARRDAAGAQGAEGRAALLEGEAGGGVHDEEPDEEGERAEGGQVQVEAGAQPLDVAASARRPDREPVGEAGRQRPVGVGRPASASARPGRRGRAAARRRRCRRRACRAAGWRSARCGGRSGAASSRAAVSGAARARSGGSAKARRRSRPAPRPARPSAGSVTGSMPTMRRLLGAAAEVALDDRRDLPAGAAQRQPVVERDPSAVARLDGGEGAAAGDRRGAVVAGARLGVQRLHAGPERGRRGEAGEQGDELERVPPPVAEERGEDRGHPSRPACSRTVAPSRAASRALWVAISSAAPASATSASISLEHRVAGRLVEAAGRLVGEDQPRPGGERPADRHPLLLAAGELLGVAVEQPASPSRSASAARRPGSWRPASRAWKARLPETSRLGIRLNCWKTMPIAVAAQRRAAGVAEARPSGVPATATVPRSASSRPAARCRSVLLPLPELAGQRQAGAGGEVERDAVEHRQRPLRGRIALGDVDEAQDGLGHARASSAPAGSARPRPVGNTWR